MLFLFIPFSYIPSNILSGIYYVKWSRYFVNLLILSISIFYMKSKIFLNTLNKIYIIDKYFILIIFLELILKLKLKLKF